jgi:hypothetical protein
MPSKKPEGEFRVGEKVRVNLHAGKIVDATIRAIRKVIFENPLIYSAAVFRVPGMN